MAMMKKGSGKSMMRNPKASGKGGQAFKKAMAKPKMSKKSGVKGSKGARGK